MVARPWSSSRLSCGECLLLRCDGKPGNSWLRLWAPNAEDPGPIPSQGTGSHMLQLKILHAAAKIKDPMCHNCRTPCIHIYIYIKTTHGQIPFSLLKDLIREENLRRKHCRGCAANVNSNSLRDGGSGGFFKTIKGLPRWSSG